MGASREVPVSTLVPAAGDPIRREDLATWFEAGSKPREDWRVGVEVEAFLCDRRTGLPLPYGGERGIESVLRWMCDHFGWSPLLERGRVIGLQRGPQLVSLEPGGQVELGGAPWHSLSETRAEFADFYTELGQAAAAMGARTCWFGYHPLADLDDVEWVPKARYEIMRRYLPRRGTMALHMMKLTGTVQANVDYASEADAARKVRAALAMTPLVTAMTANSPLVRRNPSGYRSFRQHLWLDVDPDRCGVPPFLLDERDDGFFERYAEWALDVPMIFLFRDGQFVDVAGVPFRELLEGRHPLAPATEGDWALHLSVLFPDVRIKRYIEVRAADSLPMDLALGTVAAWVGILYDDEALDHTWEMLAPSDVRELLALRRTAAREGLRGAWRGISLRQWCLRLLDEAAAGLRRRSAAGDEDALLRPLVELVERGEDAGRVIEERFGSGGTAASKRGAPAAPGEHES